MADSNPPGFEAHLERFGLTGFRPGQREVISAVFAGQDCLCIMPTGGGKSLCYQLPGVVREGVVLVISPLIALMKDQVDSLVKLDVRATFINSSLSVNEQRQRLQQLTDGGIDLLYIAPERLRNSGFLEALRSVKVQLLAVDEAHCVSEWGHDFRPDYARLGQFRRRLGFPQTIALTATATPLVRDDVLASLELREPKTFITGFARPNLRFEVQHPGGDYHKNQLLLEFLRETPGSGIIYASTRKKCEEVAELVASELAARKDARRVGLYHAGLLNEDRRAIQERFMQDRLQIIVATNAFGMGIDKPDLRFVVHYTMPGSLEAYYQEAGRAGRDGQAARCLLLFQAADRYVQEFFIDNAFPSRDTVRAVYDFLRKMDEDPIELTLQELKERLNLPVGTEGVGACEQLLEKWGGLERMASQENLASVKLDSDLPTLVDLLPREAKVQRRVLRAVENIVGDRRHERVFFPLPTLLKSAELDRDAAGRALRELMRLQSFDYVPPFRGRAVHMLQRDTPFEKLAIDFEELERRKAAELAKLERVIQFARTRRCRQLEILDYFGDPTRTSCGTCDNCSGPLASTSPRSESLTAHPVRGAAPREESSDTSDAGSSPSAELSGLALEAVRIALSGVARTRGRLGKLLVAKMLAGSRSAKLAKLRLDQLSTFGLLSHLKQSEAEALLDALLQLRLLEQVEHQRYRPTLQLTPAGERVMRGTEPLADLPVKKSLRKKLAAGRVGTVEPAERTVSLASSHPVGDESHEWSAESEPGDGDPGDGEPSLGAANEPDSGRLNGGIANVVAPRGVVPAAMVPDSPSSIGVVRTVRVDRDEPLTRPQPSYYWTWRLLDAGFGVRDCAEIRGISEDTLLDHLLNAAEQGLVVDARWVLNADELRMLEATFRDDPTVRVRQVLERLPAGFRYQQIQLYRLLHANGGPTRAPDAASQLHPA